MGFFSRNKEATGTGLVADAPFETTRRQPRAATRARAMDSHFDAPAPLDPARTAKTRARRRLIGAIALALAAIVFVPMLFDRTPVATTDDIALQIPDRDTPFEGRKGVPDPARAPLKAATDLPAVAPVAPAVVAPSSSMPQAAPDAIDKQVDKPIDKTADQPVEKPAEKPAEKPTDKLAEAAPKAVEKAAPKVAPVVPAAEKARPAAPTDDPKALAALDGRSAVAATTGTSFAVQVAAFSAAEKAKGLRDQLATNGLKSYTESVSTAQGMRVRVRLGPFASRDAADRAKLKLKTMKLDGTVVPL